MTIEDIIQRADTHAAERRADAETHELSPRYDERLKNGVKVVVMGPPHSGKSVFIEALSQAVDPELGMTMLGGCPDGEGLWLQRHYDDPEVKKLRRKGTFTPEFVEHAAESVQGFHGPLALIDIGGRVSEENHAIAAGATHAIILAGDLSKVAEWRDFADELGIPVVATLHSHYSGNGDIIHTATDERVVASTHYLERGTGDKERPSVDAVANMLDATVRGNVAYWQSAAERKLGNTATELTKPELLGALGREEALEPSDIAGLYELFAGNAAGKTYRFTGFDKGRELVALCFAALENGATKVEDNSMRTGPVEVIRLQQSVDAVSDVATYDVSTYGDDGVLIDVALDGIIAPEEMPAMHIPSVDARRVVISGRIPHWLRASMAISYAETCDEVAIFTPGEGNMIVWSKTKEAVGELC